MRRIFAYEQSRDRASLVAQDALLIAVFVGLISLRLDHLEGALGQLVTGLRVAIPLVLVWGWITLHFPARVEVGDGYIAFARYGRKHRFERQSIETISVRRFLVRDRVLIRIVPAPPWRGRYWLLGSLGDIDELLSILTTYRISRS